MAFQRIEIIGNLGKDAEVRTVGQNIVVGFNVAVTEKFGDKETTTWYSCNYWPKEDKVSQYLKKGSQVFVAGRPSLRTYSGKDGKEYTNLDIRVMDLQLIGGKPADAQPATGQGTQRNIHQEARQSPYNQSDPNDGLPF